MSPSQMPQMTMMMGGDRNETKQYYKGQEDETAKDSRLKPNSSTTVVVMDLPAVPGNPGKLDDSNLGIPAKENQPTKPIPSKGKGPSSGNSSKAPASKSSATTHPSAAARGVQERMQSTLLRAAASIQTTGTREDMVPRLENYTSLLAGLQNLVVTMAGGYEEAAEDIRALVASTLDEATQQDHAFVARASQALANCTEKYQLAMSQGENQSLHDQLACWDQVRQAGATLSQKITSLTTDYEPSTTSSEIFRALLPDCFRRIMLRLRPHSTNYMPPFPPCSASSSLLIKPGRYCLPSSPVCAVTIQRSAGWPWPRLWSQFTPFQTPTRYSNLSGRAYAGSSPVSPITAEVGCVPLNLLPLTTPL